MLKISNGKVNIFGREASLVEGTNTVFVDKDQNLSAKGTKVCTIEVSDGKVTSITSHLPRTDMGGDKILKGRYRHARRQIALCPIMGGPNLDASTEGFAFDYNYTNIGYVAIQVVPYMFTGGNVCDDSFTPWTALPASMSCGNTDYINSGSMAGQGLFDMVKMQRDSMKTAMNQISFAFTYRSGHKYFYFKRGYKGIFKCGNIKGGDIE